VLVFILQPKSQQVFFISRICLTFSNRHPRRKNPQNPNKRNYPIKPTGFISIKRGFKRCCPHSHAAAAAIDIDYPSMDSE